MGRIQNARFDGRVHRARKRRADRCRGAGEVFVQGRVAVGGRRGLFDDLVGRGFLILARRGDPIASLSESHRVFWKALGGRIATFGEAASNAADIHFDDAGGWYGRLLDEAGCDIIVKRPDYHIFGRYGAVADLPAALDDMRAQLMTKATAQPRAPLS